MGDIYVMKADVTQQIPLTTRSGIDNQWPAWQARRQSEAWWVRFRQKWWRSDGFHAMFGEVSFAFSERPSAAD
jgi:hypothetical protein